MYAEESPIMTTSVERAQSSDFEHAVTSGVGHKEDAKYKTHQQMFNDRKGKEISSMTKQKRGN